jgi:hypothetical protein
MSRRVEDAVGNSSGRGVAFAVAAIVGGFGFAAVACASSSNSSGSSTGTTDGENAYANDCAVAPGGFPKATCDNSPRLCDSPPTCSLAATCGNVNECLNTVDHTGQTKVSLRVRRLAVSAPESLTIPLVQRTILNKAMDLTNVACSERGDGSFNWIMQIDKATNRLTTGGAAPADPTGAGGYCFVRSKLNGFDVAPIDVNLTKDAEGRYTTETVPVLNVPIFVQGKRDNIIILPLRNVTVKDVTLSPSGNCIGGFRAGGLDGANDCRENTTDCPKWTTGGSLGGYISLADADKIEIIDIGKTLCTVLTNKTGSDGKSCPKTATGEPDVKGDYCSTTKSAGGCQDSYWLAATLSASAATIDANPTDPFCQAAATPTSR